MKLLRFGVFSLLLVVNSCGLFSPEDGTVVVYGTFIGVIPDDVQGVRFIADFRDPYRYSNYPNLDDLTHRGEKRVDISEAVIWTDEAFRASHHARGDSSTIKTTFTLSPEDYTIRLQQILPPQTYGGGSIYDDMGSDSYRQIDIHPRKTITVRLRGTFD
jgi:hypothetical protein